MIWILLVVLAVFMFGPPSLPFLMVGAIVWVSLQCRESKARVWADRRRRFFNHPLMKVKLVPDLRHIYIGMIWPFRKGGTEWDKL